MKLADRVVDELAVAVGHWLVYLLRVESVQASRIATTPWPPAAQIEIRPRPPPASCSCLASRGDDPPAGCGERVAGRERAAVDVELGAVDRAERGVEAEPLLAEDRVLPGLQRAQHLGGERLVDLVEVEVAEPEAVALEHPRHRVGGGHQQALLLGHEVDRGGLRVDEVGERLEPVRLGPLLAAEQHRGGAVGERRRVRRGHRPLGAAEDRAAAWRASRPSSRGAGCRRARARGRG